MWNPDVYLAFADHRSRPFFDLTARIDCSEPRRVVDLGCGPGNLTATFAQRWPQAVIEALDSSPEMVDAARARGVDASVGSVTDWSPAADTDVVVSNATLHWVPEHPDLVVRWAQELASGSWLAFQVPGNWEAPSHTALVDVARREQFAKSLQDMPFQEGPVVRAPADYAGLLIDAGCTVDAWETTYVHELTGPTPVLDWITGSALTAVTSRLSEEAWQQYREQLIPLLAQAYPARSDGRTFYPFRRIFVVARKN
ncbi:trans-aconitate methyltransferase [Mycobacterium sp. MS1601]|uniref:trans-aconitate 2-methyltransferase n=1 Tax=Mycobacterium sp. MS1601 TaxID=1936029 RepID=UPI0009791203|nr:trans-aconitate 2-methyltransferase [Mycobacterium sp. MS1601]AQA03637.1 trans-aconitate methyltransferase [Mycobacterium sp. MS1601]